jgi:ribonucleoside-diphosphate reductase beta chain
MNELEKLIEEPLLNEKRLALFPIKYQDIWEMYKKSESCFWTQEEIDFHGDKKDFDALSPNEQFFITHILSFFAHADALVFDNIDANFGEEIALREAKTFYSFQKMMEGIHNEVYSAMIENLISDPQIKDRTLNAIQHYPGIKKKADWALKYMNKNMSFAHRLVAFVIIEYLFFSASFAAIFYFKKRGKMNGLCFSNELISRDEGLHAQFGVLLYTKYLKNKLHEDTITDMINEAVNIELEFVNESLPVSLLGMNCQEMSLYVKYIADHMSMALGYDKLFEVQNPFTWMDIISLQGKTNFFEKRVGEYSKAGFESSETEKFVFSTSDDF